MPFVKATIEVKQASVGTGIKASLRQTKKSAANLSFSISEPVGKDLGFSDGDKIEVMIGEKEHHGLLRIRKNNSAGQTPLKRRATAKGAWFALKLGHQEMFVDRSEPSAWCQWDKVQDGWVEIVLPRWADETAPSKAQQPIQKQAAYPQRPAGNATANIMGDPPAGRSALAAKG